MEQTYHKPFSIAVLDYLDRTGISQQFFAEALFMKKANFARKLSPKYPDEFTQDQQKAALGVIDYTIRKSQATLAKLAELTSQ